MDRDRCGDRRYLSQGSLSLLEHKVEVAGSTYRDFASVGDDRLGSLGAITRSTHEWLGGYTQIDVRVNGGRVEVVMSFGCLAT
jgi:hypothetical protein